MAWWRVSNVPTAWPATEGQAPTAAAAPVLQVEQQGGYVGVPEKAPPAPPNHAIPHAAALKNARLALARLTESIQSIAHPSAQDAVSGSCAPFGHARPSSLPFGYAHAAGSVLMDATGFLCRPAVGAPQVLLVGAEAAGAVGGERGSSAALPAARRHPGRAGAGHHAGTRPATKPAAAAAPRHLLSDRVLLLLLELVVT